MTIPTPNGAARRPSTLGDRLRGVWFQVHLWIGVALSLLFIPIGLTGAAMVWPGLLSPPVPVSAGSAALPAGRYLDAAQAALGDKATPYQVRLPAEAGQPVTVMARPAPRDHGARSGEHSGGAGGDGHHGHGGRHAEPATGSDGPAPAAAPRPGGPVAATPAKPAAGAPSTGGRARPITVLLAPDARVISIGAGGKGALWVWLHTFHERLFIDGWGRSAVGWIGVAMLISALTGLWLWWPRAGDFLHALRWKRASGPLLNLHYATGFWICLPLALLALSGAALGFPQPSRSLVGVFAPVTQQGPGGPGGGGQRPLAQPHLTPDAAVDAARRLQPNATLFGLTLPTRAQPVWKVEFARSDTPLQVDDASGAAVPAPGQPGGDVFWRWVHRVHGGDDMPVLWKLVLTLAGLAPTILGVTGVSVWIGKSRRKAARKVRPTA